MNTFSFATEDVAAFAARGVELVAGRGPARTRHAQ
jgi:hypothetical protein